MEEASPYIKKAVEISLKGNDPVQIVYAYSVYGSLLIKNKEWQEAAQILQKGVVESRKMESPQLIVKCITPLLSVFDHLQQTDSVKYYMNVAEKELSQLAPNAIEVLGFYETKGDLLAKYGQYRESLDAFRKIENLRGKNLHTPLDLLYYRFANNYYGLKEYVSAYEYMKKAYSAKILCSPGKYKSNCLI